MQDYKSLKSIQEAYINMKMNEGKQTLEEKLSSSEQKELDKLIDKVFELSDPEYMGSESVDNISKYINQIKDKFGEKIANDVESGIAKMHYPRHKSNSKSVGLDKLASRGGSRTTKDGKANKQDLSKLKNQIKRGY